jgi:hypothetical protein
MMTLALITSMAPVGSVWAVPWEAELGTWSGSLGLDYASDTQTTQSANAQESKTSNQLFRETLKIANTGFYVIDPRLWIGNLELELGFDQNKSGGAGASETSQGRLIDYSFDSTFLAEKPYTASVFANRNQSQSLQPFGGRREGVMESHGAIFILRQDSVLNDWGFPWFESNLSLRSQHNKSKTSIFGQSLETDETSKILEFNANKGFETADLGLNYQINDQRNLAFSQGNFQSKAAGLVYSIDFGPTLNRRFDANTSYMTRNGSAPSTTASTSERLHIDHSQNLKTDYLYGFTRQDTNGSSSTMQNGGFSVAHQLYQNLSTTAGVSGSRGALPNGSTSSYGGRLAQSYHHSLPGKGIFSANWSGGYQLNSNNLSSSLISIIDEAHSAPSPLVAGAGFLLNHSFVEATSIVVVNVAGGGRNPTTAGVDYDVITEGNLIRIVPMVGSLRILAGDPLVVSYNYKVDPSLKFASKSSGFGMGVDYRWLAVAFSHQQSEQTPLSGDTSLFLESSRQNIVLISSQGTLLEMPANANLDFNNYKSNSTAYDGLKFGSALIWEVKSNMRMIFGLGASETQYTLPSQHKNASRSARTSLDWYTLEGWSNSASLDWSSYSDSGAPPQTLMSVNVRSSRTVGKLSLTASAHFSEWLRNGSRSTDLGFNINAVRQF